MTASISDVAMAGILALPLLGFIIIAAAGFWAASK